MICIRGKRQTPALVYSLCKLFKIGLIKQGPKVETQWESGSLTQACATSSDAVNLCLGKYSQHCTVVVTELLAGGEGYKYLPVPAFFKGDFFLTIYFYCHLHALLTKCIVPVLFLLLSIYIHFIFVINEVWQVDMPSSSPLHLFMFKVLTLIPFLFYPGSDCIDVLAKIYL